MIRLLALMLGLALAAPAFAGPVELRPDPVDDDGRVTLGELFDDAGAAAETVVARRSGPSVVLDAALVQSRARAAGLDWANITGLRRVVVRAGASPGAASAEAAGRPASAVTRPGATVEVLTYARSLAAGDIVQPEDIVWGEVQAHRAPAGAPQDADEVIGLSARRALRAGTAVASRDLASPQVIARNDMVAVSFVQAGVRLTLTGRALKTASVGENFPVLNVQSGRTIEAVATGPGRAITGPAALAARQSQQFAAVR